MFHTLILDKSLDSVLKFDQSLHEVYYLLLQFDNQRRAVYNWSVSELKAAHTNTNLVAKLSYSF